MSEQPGESDPAGRRPAGPASSAGRDRLQVAQDSRGRFERRLNGANEIRWAVGPDGGRTGDILAHLAELHTPLPDAGQPRPGVPLGPDGRPRGSQFFDEGISDLFPSGTPVDWVAWAAVENQIAAQIRRGHQVRLTTRAVQDPASRQPSVALRMDVLDLRTGQIAQYPFASLAQYAAAQYLGPARTPGAPQPVRPAGPQQQPPAQPQQQPAPGNQGTTQAFPAVPMPVRPPQPAQQAGATQAIPTVPMQPVQPGQQVGAGQQGGPTWWTPPGQGPQSGQQATRPFPTQPLQPVPAVQQPAPQPAQQQTQPVPSPAQVRAGREAFARGVLGTAFGVVAAEAVPLQDGGIRLNEDGDVVERETLERMTAQLVQRAEQQATGPRMLAEAVAMVGDHAARMAGEAPADGATEALDLLLDVPFLPEENRAEAEAVLNAVLASTADPAPRGDQPPRMSVLVAGAEEISRDVRVLGATGATTAPPAVPGRRRPAVGNRHRRVDRTVGVQAVRGTELTASGRPRGVLELTPGEALNAAGRVPGSVLGGRVEGDPVVQGGLVVVNTEQFGPQYFAVEIGQPGLGRAAAVDVRAGSSTEPHVVRMPPRLAAGAVRTAWVGAISTALQEKAAVQSGSTGILSRVHDAFTGATKDRRSEGQYAQFRLMARDWEDNRDYFAQYGQPQTAQRMRDLERDIMGLTAVMDRAPIVPWQAGAVTVNAVPARTPQQPGARGSAIAHLRNRVGTEIDRLEAAATYLSDCKTGKETSAAAAGTRAGNKEREATTEAALLDSLAPERARTAGLDAAKAIAEQQRHEQIAVTYGQAADRATAAATTYRGLLTQLDAVAADPNRPLDQVRTLAAKAKTQAGACRERFGAALPPDEVMSSAVAVGRLPHLNALTRHANERLDGRGVRHRFGPAQLHLQLRSNLGQVLGDGLIMQAANVTGDDASKQAEVMVRLVMPDRYDATEGAPTHSEMIVGQLDQRNHTVTTTVTQARGFKARYGLKKLLRAIPGSGTIKAVGEVIAAVSPRVEVSGRRGTALTSVSAANGRRASVEDIRGEAVAIRSDHPVWDVRVRTSPFEPWSEPSYVDASGPDDSQSATVRLSHAYTVPAPQPHELTDIAKEGAANQRVTQMPEHMATYVGRMNEISDEAAVELKRMLGEVDPVAYGQLRSMVNEWPGRLDEALVPGGIGRTIVNKGVPACWVTMESRWVPGSAQMVGQRSTAHWTERVRVGIATTGIGQSISTSGDRAVAGGFDFDDIGPTNGTLGPTATVTRGRTRDEGVSTSNTNYEVGVERVQDTVGIGGRIEHVMTVHKLGSDEKFDVTRDGRVLLRMAENDAFRYGFPVPAEAVVRGPDGKPLYHPVDNRILLRGDPQPAGKDVVVPYWMGSEDLQLRGKGPGQAGVVTGIDTVATLRALEAEGILPPLDANLQPDLSGLPADYDRELLTSQLENLERARQGVSGMRAGTKFDQAAQGGVTVPLELRRSGALHAPQRFVLDLTIDQQFTPRPEVIGVNPSVKGLHLEISSRTSSHTTNRSGTVKGAAELGLRGGDELGGMDFPKIGPGFNGQFGSNQGVATNVTSNDVLLREPGMDSVTIRSRFGWKAVLRSRGDSVKPLAGGTGYADMLVEGEQCRPAPAQQFYSVRGEVTKDVLDKADLIHADGGKQMLSRLWDAMPPATKADPTAYHQLAAFCDIRNLVADREWMRKVHRTRLLSPVADTPALAVQQLSLSPSDVTVELRARVVGLERTSPPGSPVSGRINLTLTSSGSTSGTSRGGGVGVSGGAGAPDYGASYGASGDVGRGVTNSWSRTSARIGGAEMLGIETGVHDDFRARIVWEAVVKQGGKSTVVALNDGAALMSIPERRLLSLYAERKLDLPVERTVDTVERYLNGRLRLDRRTASALIRRYRKDKDGVTTGLAVTHTAERLDAAVRFTAGIQPAASAQSPAQQLDEAVDQAELLGRQRVAVLLPEHYERAMGESIVTEYTLFDPLQPRRPVRGVDSALNSLIEQQSPGLLERDGALADALSGELEGERWLGHRNRLLSVRGHVREYSVKMSDNGPPARVRVRMWVRWIGPATTDGTPDPPAQPSLNVLQQYMYLNESQARTRSVNFTANLNLNAGGFGPADPTLGAGSHRVHALQASKSSTVIGIKRLQIPDPVQVARQYALWMEVEVLPAPGTLKGRAQRAKPVPKVGQVLVGEMKLDVPREFVGASSPDKAPAVYRQADHRAVTMTGNPYFPGTAEAYLSGEAETDHLLNALSERLGRRDLLGTAGLAAHQAGLEDDTSPEQLQSWFAMVMSEDGYSINEREVPGKRYKVGATIRGRLYDLALTSPPLKGVEIGEAFRGEEDAQNSFTGNRAQPLTRTIGTGGADADFGASLTSGEQVTDKVTDLSGSRVERSMFIKPENAVVVRMRYSLDVDYTKRGLRSTGEPKIVDSQRNAAVGEVWVMMDHKDYLAMRAQLESGAEVAPPPSARKLDVRRVAADEVIAGPNGPARHPYRPLVAALAQARQEGVLVSLTLRRPDGSSATYQAGPEGTLTGGGDDKFAAAFASLRPHLALLADESRLPLHQLYYGQQGQGSFTKTVSDALKGWGVPAAIVDEAAHSLANLPAARPTPGTGSNQHPGARQHVGTTYSPGPTGNTGMSF